MERTWELLVSPSAEGNRELVNSLASTLGEGKGGSDSSETAEYLLQLVVGAFLVNLDPSYATAVSSHRQIIHLERIENALDDRRGFSEHLSQLPPQVARVIESEVANGSIACERLAKLLAEFASSSGKGVRGLAEDPPEWLRNAPIRLWVSLAEFAGAFQDFELAALCFEKAALEGAHDKGRLLALSSIYLSQLGETERAKVLASQAASAESYEEYVMVAQVLANGDPLEAIADIPDDAVDTFLILVAARANLSLEKYDEAIELAERALALDPQSTGSHLTLAEALEMRVIKRQVASRENDLLKAIDLSIRARNLRRAWHVPSGDAVAIACQGSLLLRDEEAVLRYGMQPPIGEATPDESSSPRVLAEVARVALVRYDIALAQSSLALLPDGFERRVISGRVLQATGNLEAARASLHDAFQLAVDEPSRREIQLHLASMGEDPLPDQEILENENSEGSALILATAEATSGRTAEAITRLRVWRNHSPACAELLASIQASEGNHSDSALTLADAANRFHEPHLLVEAAKYMLAAGQLEKAELYAEESLQFLTHRSSARRTSLNILLHVAESKRDWQKCESLARTLVADDPLDTKAQWSLVRALFNARLFPQAWHEIELTKLEPNDESEARAWLELATRHSKEPDLVDRILDLADTYQTEEFGSAALGAVLRVEVADEWPEARITRFHNAIDDFFDRFPESQHLERIPFGSPEEIFQGLRERLEPGARHYRNLVREVSLFQKPYIVLAAAAGRPYALAFIQRAAGCLTVSVSEPVLMTEEIGFATEALNGTLIIDASAIVTASLIPEIWPITVRAFQRIGIIEPSRADILLTRDYVMAAGLDTISWDEVSEAPVLHTVTEADLGILRSRASWVADAALELDNIPFVESRDGTHSDDPRMLAALGPLDHASTQGLTLYSDDAFLRAVARSMGVKSFGTVALIHALAVAGNMTLESVSPLLLELRRQYCVDLPPDAQQILALVEEEEWSGGAGMFAFTRPSLWKEGTGTLALFRACAKKAYLRNPDLLASWFAAGLTGLGSFMPVEQISVVAAQMLLTVQEIPGADPVQFALLTHVARTVCEGLGAADPTEEALRAFLDTAISQFGPAQGAQALLAITERLEGGEREIVRRLIFLD